MAEFTEAQKRFVIEAWACDLESKEIATRFVEHFQEEGVTIEQPSSAQLARYNPDFAAGASMSKPHRTIFNNARRKFREDVDSLPAAHKNYRIRELTTLYLRQKKKNSDVIAADLLKQIAQERGKMFERQERAVASPAEIDAYVKNMAMLFRTAVEKHVKDEGVVASVRDEIQAILESAA